MAHRQLGFGMISLTFVWKYFQDRNFQGVVVRLYEQSIESWVGLFQQVRRDSYRHPSGTFSIAEIGSGYITCGCVQNTAIDAATCPLAASATVSVHSRT